MRYFFLNMYKIKMVTVDYPCKLDVAHFFCISFEDVQFRSTLF